MQPDTASNMYRAWLAALNSADWPTFVDLLADDAVFTFSHRLPDDSAHLRGSAAVLESFRGWRSGFAQLTGQVVESIGIGERAAVRLWWTGATVGGRPVAFAACHWVGTREDKIVEIVDFFDEKTYDAMVGR